MKFPRIAVFVLMVLSSCNKTRSVVATSANVRELPPVGSLSAPAQSEFLPAPVSAGGGDAPLASVLKDPPAAAKDGDGRNWTALDTRPFVTPRSLRDTHCYFVLFPDSGGHGLLGGGTRQYSDFIGMDRPAAGGISFHAEDAKDSVRRFGLPADKVPANTPVLIEIHPSRNGNPVVSVNGHKAGETSPLHSIAHFGAGYVNTRYHGKVGEIRLYQNLTPAQSADIALLLKTRWHLPGGLAGPPAECQENATLVTASAPAARCGPLTVRFAGEASSPVLVSASPPAAPLAPNSAHPAATTVVLGRVWSVRLIENSAAPELHFTFPADATLPVSLLDEHGFYSLLHADSSTGRLTEVSATRPAPDGLIHFPSVPARPGFYTLAVTQGIPLKSSPAALLVNGAAAESHTITPGIPVTLTTRDTVPDQLLTLTDSSSGIPWYQGPAAGLHLTFRPLRADIPLSASFSLAPGHLASTAATSLRLDPAAPRLYPGLLARIVRRAAEVTDLPAPEVFAPEIRWPADSPLVDTAYPAFRTADIFDSLTTPASRPRYFHTVLPSLNLAPDPKQSAPRGAIHKYPLGDLTKDHPVHARFSGFILPDREGLHEFRWESSLPSRILLGGAARTGRPASITLNLTDLRPVPLEIDLTNHPAAALDSRLLWKRPGAADFTPVPAAALVHPVDGAREKALAAVTGNFAHRKSDTTRCHEDAAVPAFHPTTTKVDPAYFTDVTHLAETFLHGRTRAGDPSIARTAFELIRSRSGWFRANNTQFPSGAAFGKTYGPDMNLFVTLQPFLHACENHPALQQEALAARAEYAQYASSSILNRSFLSESTNGANDCYDADHNLAVNFWRAATALDSPYAWDAATCLFDNHFRVAPGASEGMCADGIIDFHNANGRHIHMSGYGIDWFGRIGLSNNRVGTPWAMTTEQTHRIVEYLRAYEWFIYQNTTSFVCNGRHNSHSGGPENLANHAGFLLGLPEKALRPADRQALTDLRKRIASHPGNSITGHRFFFRNLYTVHRGPDFFIDVKMISPLAGGPETFAGSIPWNMSYGDGVTTLMRHGKEYGNIHRGKDNAAFAFGWRKITTAPDELALWHYRQHPGTTQLDHELRAPDRYRSGGGTLAGGASDGTLGHCAFHHVNGNAATTHRKLYAFTEDGMAVLTTAITNTSPGKETHPADVTFRTNLNQCDWLTDVKILSQDGKQNVLPLSDPGGTFTLPLNQRYWIEHDGIGYLILPTGHEGGPNKPGTLQLALTTRSPLTTAPGFALTKAQSDILTASGLPAKRTAKIFHLSIDHGQKPKDARCAYFVCMTAAKAAPKDWLANPPFQIHSNTPEIQSLTDLRDGTTHAIFSQPGELRNAAGELLLATDHPASLMWRPATQSLTAQDPIAACTSDITKMADTLRLRLGAALTNKSADTGITLQLPGTTHPDDRHRGAPVTQKVP